jgi:hypothetical protein
MHIQDDTALYLGSKESLWSSIEDAITIVLKTMYRNYKYINVSSISQFSSRICLILVNLVHIIKDTIMDDFVILIHLKTIVTPTHKLRD